MINPGAGFLRHELRGFLSLILSYTDLLTEETQLRQESFYDKNLLDIRQSAQDLKDQVNEFLGKSSEELRSFGIHKVKQEFYSPLYSLIASAQDAKELCKIKKEEQASRDFDKILKFTGSILNLLEGFFTRLSLDNLAESAYHFSTRDMTDLEDSLSGEMVSILDGTILIVDDDDMNRALLSLHLKSRVTML
mgnify:CR=1 FL=1